MLRVPSRLERKRCNGLSVSPQCGFANHTEGNALDKEDMRNKLKLVRRIADEVWPGEP